MTNEEASGVNKKLSLNRPWNHWYFQHVDQINLNGREVEEKILLDHYLFRHDWGAFWMGAYALGWGLFFRYLVETQLRLTIICRTVLGKTQVSFKLRKLSMGFRLFY